MQLWYYSHILKTIDEQFDSDHLPRIQRFVRQPPVSATGEGTRETAEMVMQLIRLSRWVSPTPSVNERPVQKV
ncbi:MAG: hypothetical protein HY731_07755 [Candidatus Tectomicrobia bacterium]|nr:hypothetical protein [Candidatus Tectomicrobia bacterium]